MTAPVEYSVDRTPHRTGFIEVSINGAVLTVDNVYMACGYTDLRRGIDGLQQ